MTSPKQALLSSLASAAAISLAGCGGAMPLGHPAHVLRSGKTTAGAGVAGTIAVDPRTSVASPWAAQAQTLTVAPDVSPWVSARVGLGTGFEGGLSASLRSIRLDARHAFETEKYALSIGVGASAVLAQRSGGGQATGVYGAGFDVPILVGWRSSSDLYSLWLGPRAGGEILGGQLENGDAGPGSVSARHAFFGGLAGIRAGLRHLYVVAEFDFAYHLGAGSWTPPTGAAVTATESVDVSGWAVTPFGALVVSF